MSINHLWLLLASISGSWNVSLAQRPAFVCRVVASQEAGEMAERVGTGFQVHGEPGIYTALHIVAGATTITCQFPDDPSIRPLTMVLKGVDLKRDVALLVPKVKTDKLPVGGFVPAKADEVVATYSEEQTARVLGFPNGQDLASSDDEIRIRRNALVPLTKLINAELRAEFVRRGSPSPTITVLNLSGLNPGDSGAPILNLDGHLIAMATGGHDRGRVGKDWAMPFAHVNLVDISSDLVRRINRLGVIEDSQGLLLRRALAKQMYNDVLRGIEEQKKKEGAPSVHLRNIRNLPETFAESLALWQGATGERIVAEIRSKGVEAGLAVVQTEQRQATTSEESRHLRFAEGTLLRLCLRWDEACDLYRSMSETSDGSDAARCQLEWGRALAEMGKLDEATEKLVAASTLPGLSAGQQLEAQSWLGHCYMQKGRPDLAVKRFADAAALSMKSKGPARQRTPYVMGYCANAYADNGNDAKAQAYFSDAISRIASTFEDRGSIELSTDTSELLTNFASYCSSLQENTLADRAARLAFALSMLEPHLSQRSRPAVFDTLGVIALRNGRIAEAEALGRRALTLAEAEYTVAHPEVALIEQNLAETYRQLGDLPVTAALTSRVLDRRFQNGKLGTWRYRHHFINNLGITAINLGDDRTAIPILLEALRHGSRTPNEKGRILGNIANCYSNQRDSKRANAYYLLALKTTMKTHARRSPAVARLLGDFGAHLARSGNIELAKRCYGHAISIDRTAETGSKMEQVSRVTAGVTLVLGELTNSELESSLYRLFVESTSIGVPHERQHIVTAELGTALATSADYEESAALLILAIQAIAESNPNSKSLFHPLSNLSQVCFRLKKYHAAGYAARSAVAIGKERLPANDANLVYLRDVVVKAIECEIRAENKKPITNLGGLARAILDSFEWEASTPGGVLAKLKSRREAAGKNPFQEFQFVEVKTMLIDKLAAGAGEPLAAIIKDLQSQAMPFKIPPGIDATTLALRWADNEVSYSAAMDKLLDRLKSFVKTSDTQDMFDIRLPYSPILSRLRGNPAMKAVNKLEQVSPSKEQWREELNSLARSFQ